MSDKVIDFFSNLVSNKELLVFIVSCLPIVELRGAIPLAVLQFGFSLQKAFILSVTGNILIAVPLVFLMDLAEKKLRNFALFDKLLNRAFKKAEERKKKIEKYKSLGLFTFVAIPLPGTGAWTGALIAYLLAMKKWQAFISIAFGVLFAGVLVTFFTAYGVKGLLIGIVCLFAANAILTYFLDKIYSRA